MADVRRHRPIFFAFAAAFAFTAVFHAAAAIRPSVDPDAPTWRHLLFVGINVACIAGLLRRPLVFIPFFAILTIQQLATHGSHIVRLWTTEGVIDFPSIAVVVVMPTALICLVIDARDRRSAQRKKASSGSLA